MEEQFYLFWPLLLMRMKTLKQARALCVGVFVASILYRLIASRMSPDGVGPTWFLPARAGELAVGGYLAMAYRDGQWSRLRAHGRTVALLGMSGFLGACATAGTFRVTAPIVYNLALPCITIGYAGLLILALGNGLVSRLAQLRLLRWFGGISYGLYVIHELLHPICSAMAARLLHQTTGNSVQVLTFALGAGISIPLAALSLRYFETPFLALRKRYQAAPVTT